MNKVAIIQARMGSTRLPGKAMLPILGKPVLGWMVERVKSCTFVDKVVVATTPKSPPIINYCCDHGIDFFVGDEDDVIKRVCMTAAQFRADVIVDLTSDCPLVDPFMIDNLLLLRRRNKYYSRSYYSNIEPRSWPDGFDCQVYPAFLLYETENQMTKFDPSREHSGWNILQRRKKDLDDLVSKPAYQEKYNLPKMRLTLDYSEDFEVIKHIIEHFNSMDGYWHYHVKATEIIDYVLANPQILVNKHLEAIS